MPTKKRCTCYLVRATDSSGRYEVHFAGSQRKKALDLADRQQESGCKRITVTAYYSDGSYVRIK